MAEREPFINREIADEESPLARIDVDMRDDELLRRLPIFVGPKAHFQISRADEKPKMNDDFRTTRTCNTNSLRLYLGRLDFDMKSTIYYGEARFVLDDDEIKGKFHKKECTKRAGYRWQLQKAFIECRMRSETAKPSQLMVTVQDDVEYANEDFAYLKQAAKSNFAAVTLNDDVKVSWVRHRDIHLLTVGRYTYTSDQRFEAIHTPHTEEWTLRIRYPQRKDSGIYECQISTTPPIGHPVFLTIVEPITEILGGPDLFINMGSTINLTCLVRFAPEPPPSMLWAHNAQVINFDSPRGGISLVTEKGQVTTSRLLIQKAVQSDSGLYTCTPSNANAASPMVAFVADDLLACLKFMRSDTTTLSRFGRGRKFMTRG
ncbi:hypothetical protein GEV33_009638 [Tenebrio molitor]|uniref:Ig-like domain-containing protein n=1 Tax=Tenebrio molitor TaxID=7067 RepID=A0A8J6HGD8_TENMO|nr:hypothetical protein GEV33_009638 [Tenebrio molitor]